MHFQKLVHPVNKLLLLLLIFVGSESYTFANPPDEATFGKSILIFESKSSDILFYVDDSLYSSKRTDTLSVLAGYHSLRASISEADLWSAIDWTWRGDIIADSTYHFNIIAKRFVLLNSVPYGADVIIDGNFMGTTPYLLESTGKAIELIKSNYMPLRIEPGEMNQQTLISVILVAESPVAETELTPTFANLGYDRETLIVRSTYAITAITGVAAVFFKFEADKAFNKLSDTVDPADIRFYTDRVEKYDNLAAISFGTFQAGFLYSIYRVIRHR